MPTDIIMPQMGESIVEGTITKWLKKPGDKVQRDEPLFEISTDKVDAEIPAPASGVLREIKVSEGTTVGVNTVVGTIAADGEAADAPAKPVPATAAPEKAAPVKQVEKRPAEVASPSASAQPSQESAEEEARSSPLVRKIAREHGVNLSRISGTGLGGRITKQDILSFIEAQSSAPAAAAAASSAATPAPSAP
ncbi:MAG: biotin/lipoyl-containing protein, partial [Candidatus Sulfotelmatobacter sp.]